MVKKYTLLYGVQATNMDEVGARVARALDLKVVLREGLYSGEHVSCEGHAVDWLSIYLRDKKYLAPLTQDPKKYAFVLYVRNYKGKNIEKEARHNHVKKVLGKIAGLTLLKEEVEETKY
ncbi:MAG TPA: hypothetical protein VFO93_07945 [Hymenobacter sp.]|uniref:hypothetical protein n=1 Tax=Hymenobacter sp. TaxID=1898978 RepID=UPI002D804E1D|nr:hypothetical protein [Hymenobacter sp.]HET9503457.1 hypothetical protein [Hymenobacter sp.]